MKRQGAWGAGPELTHASKSKEKGKGKDKEGGGSGDVKGAAGDSKAKAKAKGKANVAGSAAGQSTDQVQCGTEQMELSSQTHCTHPTTHGLTG